MASTTYRFQKITWPGRQYGPCRECGKKAVVRQRTFVQTVNPFNKDKETGRMKTPTQIQREVREQARAWSELQPICTGCE